MSLFGGPRGPFAYKPGLNGTKPDVMRPLRPKWDFFRTLETSVKMTYLSVKDGKMGPGEMSQMTHSYGKPSFLLVNGGTQNHFLQLFEQTLSKSCR
jgi:hypothetical protein